MLRLNTIIALFLFLITFFIFVMGVSPSVYGGDSGDIILAAWFGGVAHPPGYPLNTMIGWIFTHLPFEATVAYKADVMAAFLQASVIGFFFLIVQKITKNIFVSFSTALILAFTPLFWFYAHTLEVFQLNLFLISISVYFLLSWRESIISKKEKDKLLFISVFALGLAVFHHHTSVLLFPAYLYLIYATRKKVLTKFNLLKMAIVFSLGALPYLFIPFAAYAKTPINWDDPITLKNLVRLITRADYGTFTASDFILGSNLRQKYAQLANLFLFIKADFAIAGLFILVGMYTMFIKFRHLFWFTTLAFTFCGPFFLIYSGFPFPNNFYIGLWERFLLVTYFFLAIFLTFGLLTVFDFTVDVLKSKLKLHRIKKVTLSLLLTLLITLFVAYQINSNFHKTNLSEFYLGDWLGQDILASASENSIVFVFGDTSVFNTQYVYYTNLRPRHIKLIKGGSLYAKEYREQVAREFPMLNIPDDFHTENKNDSASFVAALIMSNKDHYDIFAIDFMPQIDGFKWSSSGLLKKLVTEEIYEERSVKAINDEITSKFLFNDFGKYETYEHYMSAHIKEIYSNAFIDLADELIIKGRSVDAISYLNQATHITPNSKKAFIRLGNIYYSESNCEDSRNAFEQVYKIDDKDWQALAALSKLYGECFNDLLNESIYKQRADDLRSKLNIEQF